MGSARVSVSAALPRVRSRQPRPAEPSVRLRQLNRDPLAVLTALKQAQGDVARARLGGRALVLVSDPNLVKHVLVDNAANYVRAETYYGRTPAVPVAGATLPNELDLEARRTVQPAFSRTRIESQWPDLLETAAERTAVWPEGRVVNILEEVRRLVIELSIRSVFLRDLDVPMSELAPRARLCMSVFSPASSRGSDLVNMLRLRRVRRLCEAEGRLCGALERALEERRAEAAEGADALSLLLRVSRAKHWSPDELTTRAFALLLTISDSTTPVTAWGLYRLARDQSLYDRLRAEADSLLDSRLPFEAAAYLRAFQHEALRLYPPSWRIRRQACAPDELGGRAVEAGDYIWISPYLLHRDERFWPEPEQFRPERWQDGSTERPPRYAFIPFGAGARKCLGDEVAWRAMAATLVTVTHRFGLSLPPHAASIEFDRRQPVRRPRGGRIPLVLTATRHERR